MYLKYIQQYLCHLREPSKLFRIREIKKGGVKGDENNIQKYELNPIN
jgi:hypothetical protein